MKDVDIDALKMRVEAVLPMLNEYQRRRYLSAEAKAIGRGGITLVSRLSGVSRPTLTAGVKELSGEDVKLQHGKSRKPGGGRKSILESSPGILDALSELLEEDTKKESMCSLLWTNKSLRTLSASLGERGYRASRETIAQLLKVLGYGLQADKKTLMTKTFHANRDAQFLYINNEAKKAHASKNPVLSIDAKKKKNGDNLKDTDQSVESHKIPIEVVDHEFPTLELSKATPFEMYSIFKNKGFINVGLNLDTTIFAVESIRKWWYAEGAFDYGQAEKILLVADCEANSSNHSRLWKFEIQKLANEIKKDIQVLHHPPGASKWNKIEHKMFAFISKDWQETPLIHTVIIVNVIGTAKTEKDLPIRCILDEQTSGKGVKVTDEEFDGIHIKKDELNGEWNYTIHHDGNKI